MRRSCGLTPCGPPEAVFQAGGWAYRHRILPMDPQRSCTMRRMQAVSRFAIEKGRRYFRNTGLSSSECESVNAPQSLVVL